ncbi:PepSY domain-containing protein [Massilia sp. YMA4]|uniref:PepSY-associated TM helix domain-containing protein n=1 Tax=Massilia sp. YMA4 TaxID=1593482 RepID=UPI000DD136B8|nr:PepSY-associated TM helix domain-containing protein [Massilia sp. YMA4]AXA90832.1 PepSY domain-containing protein [Massilia sp. YMA4]
MVTGLPRKLLRNIHLYLSLAFGVLLVLAGLTGVGLTWIDELDEALNPSLLQVAGRTGPMAPAGVTAERVAGRLEADPRYGRPSGLQLPRAPDGVVIASYRIAKPDGDALALPRIRQVMVDPVTLVVLGERNWGEFGLTRPLLTSTLFHLHRYLFAGEIGKIVMGLAGLALFLIGAIGVALWWPKATLGALVKSFRIHGHWKTMKFQYSFHRSAGMIMAPVLLMLGFSGMYFNLPDWVRPAVASVATLTPTEKLQNAPVRGPRGVPIGPAQAIAAAQAFNPAGRIGRVSLPADKKTPYEIRMRQPGEVRQGDGSTRITVDAYTGQLLRVRDPLNTPAGDTFLNWQFPLHTGEAFGLAGRVVITLAGFAPLAFMVTGLVLWLGRRKKPARAVQPARPARLHPAGGLGR